MFFLQTKLLENEEVHNNFIHFFYKATYKSWGRNRLQRKFS